MNTDLMPDECLQLETKLREYSDAEADLGRAAEKYSDAEADLGRAAERKQAARQALCDFVNERTQRIADTLAQHALNVRPAPDTGVALAPGDVTIFKIHDETIVEVPAGTSVLPPTAIADNCCCPTCCEAHALASIGKPSETMFDPPPPGQYPGN